MIFMFRAWVDQVLSLITRPVRLSLDHRLAALDARFMHAITAPRRQMPGAGRKGGTACRRFLVGELRMRLVHTHDFSCECSDPLGCLRAACADNRSGSSRSIWSQSLSALYALEVVERCRRETVV